MNTQKSKVRLSEGDEAIVSNVANSGNSNQPYVTPGDQIAEILAELNAERAALRDAPRAPIKVVRGTAFASDMEIDSRIQRPEDPGLINSIVADFDEVALGTLTVSVRVDRRTGEERLIVLDGQQRRRAVVLVEYEKPLNCTFYYNMSFSEEARAFRRLNNRKSVAAPVLFRNAIAEGDEQATAIAAILSQLSIPLGVPGGFSAVVAARRIAKRPNGTLHLQWALRVLGMIYGDEDAPTKTIYDGRVVEALSMLHARDGSHLNEKHLINKLASKGGGLKGLLGRADTIATLHKGGGRVLDVIDAIVGIYNSGLHRDAGNKLAEWDRTTTATGRKKPKSKRRPTGTTVTVAEDVED